MTDLPLPVIGILLAVLGFVLTRLLAPKHRRPLSAIRPEFDEATMDETALGNEAIDMDLVRKVELDNQRLAATTSTNRHFKAGFGSNTEAAVRKTLGDRK